MELSAKGRPPEGEAGGGTFTYGELDARQRRAVAGVYTEYLKPEYDVKKSTKYL